MAACNGCDDDGEYFVDRFVGNGRNRCILCVGAGFVADDLRSNLGDLLILVDLPADHGVEIQSKGGVSMAYYIAPNATVVGDVLLGTDVSIWYGAVLRGDSGRIVVGDGTNIQDNAVVHEETVLGKNCTVGHGAIVHGCVVGDNTTIGMGAVVLNGAVIGENSIVGAGALVTGKLNAPAGSLIFGSPAKVVREVTAEQVTENWENAQHYKQLAKAGLASGKDIL